MDIFAFVIVYLSVGLCLLMHEFVQKHTGGSIIAKYDALDEPYALLRLLPIWLPFILAGMAFLFIGKIITTMEKAIDG